MNFRKLSAKDITYLALLTALNIIMAELFKIKIIPNVLELSFGFVPIAVTAMLFGPVPAIAVAALADVLGALITGVEFFPGYTLTAALTGLFYGLFLYKTGETQVKAFVRILIGQALVSVICYAGLNTLWAFMMGYGKSTQYITTRLIVNAVNYPIYVGILWLINRYRKTLERAVR